MAKFNGTTLLVYVDNVAIGLCTSHSLNVNADMIDATTKSSGGWKDVLPGLKDWSIDFDGLIDWSETENFSQAFADLSGGTKVTLKFSTEVNGAKRYTGDAYISSLSASAPMEDVVTFSGTFTGTSTLSEETVT